MRYKKILIIGEVFVDNHLDLQEDEQCIVRLGGIFHAIRACAALNIDYSFAYFAPEYLDEDIQEYSLKLKSKGAYKLGKVNKAPNVFIINGSDESGRQIYGNVLSKQAQYIKTNSVLNVLNKVQPTDVIIFPGRYGTKNILEDMAQFKGKIHIDFNYDSEDLLDFVNCNVSTAILSTSSSTFSAFFTDGNYDKIIEFFNRKKVNKLIIKENRGGAWLYDFGSLYEVNAPAYLDKVLHSVGVGDVYDIAFICEWYSGNDKNNMCLAAWMAVLYAKTMHFESFKANIALLLENADEQIQLLGIRVPWNSRKKYNIYMAAPDFDYVDTSKLDKLVDALLYHNFSPRLPIQENGQVSKDMSQDEEQKIYAKDIALLKKCDLMIATLLYNDQGTLVEIGSYLAEKKPIILYDPDKILNNIFLKYSCDYYCITKSEVINAVFEAIDRREKSD